MFWAPLFGRVASAETIPVLERIKEVIVNPIIQLLFALAFLYFLWGVAQFVMNATDSKERDVGKQHILYGLIGMFIMLSAFGLVNLICRTITACP